MQNNSTDRSKVLLTWSSPFDGCGRGWSYKPNSIIEWPLKVPIADQFDRDDVHQRDVAYVIGKHDQALINTN